MSASFQKKRMLIEGGMHVRSFSIGRSAKEGGLCW